MARLADMLPGFRSEVVEIVKLAYDTPEEREERRQRLALAKARQRVKETEENTRSRLQAERALMKTHERHGGGYVAGLSTGAALAKPIHDIQAPLGELGNMASAHALGRMEVGRSTTPDQAAAIAKHMSPDTVVRHIPQGTLNDAHFMPWSTVNHLPGAREQFNQYAGQYGFDRLTPDQQAAAFQHGTAVIPGQGGPHIAAHEMGHAQNVKSLWGKAYNDRRFRKYEKRLGEYGPLGAMAGAAMAPTYSGAETAMPIIGGLAVAPKLIEEGLASVRAVRGMKQMGYGSKDLWKARGSLGAAFGTYAAPRIIGGVGGPLAVVAMKRYADRQRDRKGLPSRAGLLRQQKKVKQLEQRMGLNQPVSIQGQGG